LIRIKADLSNGDKFKWISERGLRECAAVEGVSPLAAKIFIAFFVQADLNSTVFILYFSGEARGLHGDASNLLVCVGSPFFSASSDAFIVTLDLDSGCSERLWLPSMSVHKPTRAIA